MAIVQVLIGQGMCCFCIRTFTGNACYIETSLIRYAKQLSLIWTFVRNNSSHISFGLDLPHAPWLEKLFPKYWYMQNKNFTTDGNRVYHWISLFFAPKIHISGSPICLSTTLGAKWMHFIFIFIKFVESVHSIFLHVDKVYF